MQAITTALFAYRFFTTGKVKVNNNFWHWAENIRKIFGLSYIELVEMLLCYTSCLGSLFFFVGVFFLFHNRGRKFCVVLCLRLVVDQMYGSDLEQFGSL